MINEKSPQQILDQLYNLIKSSNYNIDRNSDLYKRLGKLHPDINLEKYVNIMDSIINLCKASDNYVEHIQKVIKAFGSDELLYKYGIYSQIIQDGELVNSEIGKRNICAYFSDNLKSRLQHQMILQSFLIIIFFDYKDKINIQSYLDYAYTSGILPHMNINDITNCYDIALLVIKKYDEYCKNITEKWKQEYKHSNKKLEYSQKIKKSLDLNFMPTSISGDKCLTRCKQDGDRCTCVIKKGGIFGDTIMAQCKYCHTLNINKFN